ncbi:conserved hypothetical protein [Methanocaldococcus vulcanius M7]|uniref:Uncharacterized protein n=1 Tax=Methanocaldococcus vulcanius (strain ATCC 700851 / DSM 12094 / M7) TaxID=579137 RepID=C9RG42_METVM|nr:hypothetical protein [Methanocaldococcus vulcanius]ACX72544.1 conserved hypothetical protein [Methanocaldococcus vulcanius M7]
MNFEDENDLFKKALEEKEKGNYDDAIYYLDWASLIAFAKGNLRKIKEIEEILSELEGKTDYLSLYASFFIKITNLMIKKEKLSDNIIDEFFEMVVEGIEETKPEIKFAIMSLKRIVNYMESMNQTAPDWVYEWIKDREEMIKEIEKFNPEKDKVLIQSKDFKKGFVMGTFVGGELDKSKMKIVKRAKMEFGIIEVDGAVIEIPLMAMNFTGGVFTAKGVKNEEHLKKIIKTIEDLMIDVYFY